jgi:hypothetical protein
MRTAIMTVRENQMLFTLHSTFSAGTPGQP